MIRTDVVNKISIAVKKIAPEAKTILFGSEARGDARPDSDIDLLILLNSDKKDRHEEESILDELYGIELSTMVQINPIIITKKQWEDRPFQTPFSINIKNEGIVL